MARNSYPLVALAMLAYIASQANLARILGPLDPSIFALQLALTPEQFWDVIARWGEAGVARYQSHFAFDFVHPFIYGSLSYVWVNFTPLFRGMSRGAQAFFRWSLPVAGACDLFENTVHAIALGHAPGWGGALITASGSASALKWGLAAVFTVTWIGSMVYALLRKGPAAAPAR